MDNVVKFAATVVWKRQHSYVKQVRTCHHHAHGGVTADSATSARRLYAEDYIALC